MEAVKKTEHEINVEAVKKKKRKGKEKILTEWRRWLVSKCVGR